MPRKKADVPVVYWDSCVFLSYIKDEDRKDGEMEGLYTVAKSIHKNAVIMITSVETLTEVLESSLTTEQENRFQKLFDRSNIELINIDFRIAMRARELRDYYQQERKRDGRPGLCQADANHLATAINYKVKEFQTFDEHDNYGCRGLLGLSGNVAGYPLVVCRPKMDQLGLL